MRLFATVKVGLIMTAHEYWILTFAFRYALGRMSTAPSIILDEIKAKVHLLSDNQKSQIAKEIREAIEFNHAGMACDVSTWLEVEELLLR